MANKKWKHLKLKNGDKVSFIPPAPDGAQLGGITQSQRESISQIQPLKSDVEQVKTDVEQVKQDVTQVKDDYLAQQTTINDHEERIETLEQGGSGDPQTESELVHAENMNTFWLENFLGHIDYLIDSDGIAQDDEGKRLVEVLNMSNRLEDEILTEIFETGIMEG